MIDSINKTNEDYLLNKNSIIEKMKPRLYQEKILATAATKNTLVVLPTGLGKSLIAKLLVEHRLKKYPHSKVILFAPTKPLASQHLKLFAEYENDIILLTGTIKPENRKKAYETKRIIISTPQGFENDIINKLVSLEDVSLIVFDEAHHATGNYAYSFIASQYKKVKNHLILGLTASPGSTEETIQEVVNNLGIEAIEYRSREDADVRPYVQEMNTKYLYVDFPEEFMKIKKLFDLCSEDRLNILRTMNLFNNKRTVTKKDLLGAQAHLHGLIAKGEMESAHYQIISILAELTKIQHALELLETQGIMQLDLYLTKLFETDITKAAKKLVVDSNFKNAYYLSKKLASEKIIHPKISALLNLIIKNRTSTFKAIIFTQYRDSAKQIIDRLNLLENIDARLFVGQAKKNGSGLSQKEQINMLKEFTEGKFNILVSSSVGEEGLDIPSVDLVVFYEPVPSAIRSIQRRGRTGRMEEGNVYILTTRGTRDEAYRWSSQSKEKNQFKILESFKKNLNKKVEIKEPICTFEKFEKKEIKTQQKKIDNYENLKLIADYREKSSEIFKHLIAEGVNVELKQLLSGDYSISNKIGIEFKTVKDFVDSIVDGRLMEQLKNLSNNYLKPILIVQGTEDIFSIRKIHPNAIRGMIAAITVGFGYNILYTKDPYDSAMMIYQILKRENSAGNIYNPHTQKIQKNGNEELEYLISSISGIGISTARDLLNSFGTVENIFNASFEELLNVKGVGKETASKIKEIYERKYVKS